jgi:Spy/CpxP family protein refolding chaperone
MFNTLAGRYSAQPASNLKNIETMKKIIVSVLALALTITAVKAQDIPERKQDGVQRHEGGKRHHGMDMADLNLSNEQKAKFKALNEDSHKQMAELRKQDNITVKESKEKMEALRKDHQAKVQALLTPEQRTQFEKKKQERRSKMQGMDKGRGEKMKKELNLTDDQSTRLDESRKKMSAQWKALHEDKSLTEEQVKEKSKELKKQQMESMKSILTEEQMKKMKEKKEHTPRKTSSI